MDRPFAEPNERRRRRVRFLTLLGIIVIAMIAIPVAWVGTLTTSYFFRIKSGEQIDVQGLKRNASLLETADSSASGATGDLNRLVPDRTVPELGNRNARLTIVAFMDYECPYCAALAPVLRRVMESEKSNVRLVIRDFPVIDAAASRVSANAAQCVLNQGQEKYWRFFDALYADQSARTYEDLVAFAKIAGADVSVFSACLSARTYDLQIDEDFSYGRSIGVDGTPTIFINRAKVQGAMSEDILREIIQRAKTALPQ